MSKRRFPIISVMLVRILWIFFLSVSSISNARAQTPPALQGQVVEVDTGLPIEGARVVLDLLPTVDPIEGLDTASAFGLFRFEEGEVAPGSYQMTTSHPAYLPDSRPIVIGGPGGSEPLKIELQKISGENFFDIYTQVSGVVSGIPLAITFKQDSEGWTTMKAFAQANSGTISTRSKPLISQRFRIDACRIDWSEPLVANNQVFGIMSPDPRALSQADYDELRFYNNVPRKIRAPRK